MHFFLQKVRHWADHFADFLTLEHELPSLSLPFASYSSMIPKMPRISYMAITEISSCCSEFSDIWLSLREMWSWSRSGKCPQSICHGRKRLFQCDYQFPMFPALFDMLPWRRINEFWDVRTSIQNEFRRKLKYSMLILHEFLVFRLMLSNLRPFYATVCHLTIHNINKIHLHTPLFCPSLYLKGRSVNPVTMNSRFLTHKDVLGPRVARFTSR